MSEKNKDSAILQEPPSGETASRCGKCKEWLLRNKIFFETITASLLSLMAIIVMVAQLYQTHTQTELIYLQAQASREMALPQFVLNVKITKDLKSSYFDEDYLVVTNKGGMVSNLKGNTYIFFRVDLRPKPGLKGTRKNLMVPINGYYQSVIYSPNGEGVMLTFSGGKNNRKLVKLLGNFVAMARENGWYGYVSLVRLVSLTYQDIFKEKHRSFYFVDPIYGGKEVSFDVGQRLWQRHFNSYRYGVNLDFDRITPETLYKLVFDAKNARLLSENAE